MSGMGRGSISPEELLGDGTLAAVGGAELPCLQHLAAWQHEDQAATFRNFHQALGPGR